MIYQHHIINTVFYFVYNQFFHVLTILINSYYNNALVLVYDLPTSKQQGDFVIRKYLVIYSLCILTMPNYRLALIEFDKPLHIACLDVCCLDELLIDGMLFHIKTFAWSFTLFSFHATTQLLDWR